jgi:hypothetical protein
MKALWIQSIAIYMLFCGNVLIAEDWPHWRGISRNGITQEDSGWDNGSWKTLDVAWKHDVLKLQSWTARMAGRPSW